MTWNTDIKTAPDDATYMQVTVEIDGVERRTAVAYRAYGEFYYPNRKPVETFGGKVVAWAPLLEPLST